MHPRAEPSTRGPARTVSRQRPNPQPCASRSDRAPGRVSARNIEETAFRHGSVIALSRIKTLSNPSPALKLSPAAIEAANRAEASALLIRCGYRVYRPEADIQGEDLVLRTPEGGLHGVQLKSRPMVDWRRYGARELLMLFPADPFTPDAPRPWFLVPHDTLYSWVKERHGAASGWAEAWSYPSASRALRAFLAPHRVQPPAEPGTHTEPGSP